jgi:RHS repeat-associated protein
MPFGEEFTPGAFHDPTLFAAGQRDAETGHDYMGARYFEARLGRFLRPDDPGYADLANPQTWNLYAYASNNPLRYVDPTGHFTDCPAETWDPKTGTLQTYVCGALSVTAPRSSGVDPWLASFQLRDLFRTQFAIRSAQVSGFFKGAGGTIEALWTPGLPSCFGMFVTSVGESLNPFTPDASDVIDEGLGAASFAREAQAVRYAASRTNSLGGKGLLYPMRSSVYRRMIAQSKALGKASGVVTAISSIDAVARGLGVEWDAVNAGRCR